MSPEVPAFGQRRDADALLSTVRRRPHLRWRSLIGYWARGGSRADRCLGSRSTRRSRPSIQVRCLPRRRGGAGWLSRHAGSPCDSGVLRARRLQRLAPFCPSGDRHAVLALRHRSRSRPHRPCRPMPGRTSTDRNRCNIAQAARYEPISSSRCKLSAEMPFVWAANIQQPLT